jgi:hypothetical protein
VKDSSCLHVPRNLIRTADYLSAALEHLGFIIMSKTGGEGLPLVAVRLNPEAGHLYDEFAIAHHLRERGWVVPAYSLVSLNDSGEEFCECRLTHYIYKGSSCREDQVDACCRARGLYEKPL